jgi:hypothetical protein
MRAAFLDMDRTLLVVDSGRLGGQTLGMKDPIWLM